MADEVDVLGYLSKKGLHLKKAGGWEVHCACMFCGEDPQKRGRLYINTDPQAEVPGLFMCHRCGEKGSLASIMRHFGDDPKADKVVEDSATRRDILAAAAAYYHAALADTDAGCEAFEWLRNERGLELETIVAHQIGYADGGLYKHLRQQGYSTKDILDTGLVIEDRTTQRVVDFLKKAVTIPYHTAGNVTMIRGRSFPYDGDGPKYKTPPRNQTRLFNSDATWNAETLIACEGEFDALILEQNGYRAVGVPGANIWQDAWDGYVANLKKFYVLFDPDDSGLAGREKLRDKFGPKVRYLELPPEDGYKDPTDWFVKGGHTADELGTLLEAAGRSGLLVSVRDAINEHAEIQGLPGVKFGIELLDLMIEPGLLDGQVLVVLAKTGTGKTIFCLNVMHLMAMVQPDLKFLFVSLEQTRGEWWERARRIYRFHNLDASDEDAERFWQDRILLIDKNRVTEGELNSALDDYIDQWGVKPILVIDYLGYWAQSFKGDRYERTSDAIMSIKGISKDRRLKTILPHQVSRVARDGEEFGADAARDAGVIEETADFIFTLWSPDNQLGRDEKEKSGGVNLRIGKSRHGGRGAKIALQMAPLSLAIVPESHSLAALARDEVAYKRDYVNRWETAHLKHLGRLPREYVEPDRKGVA